MNFLLKKIVLLKLMIKKIFFYFLNISLGILYVCFFLFFKNKLCDALFWLDQYFCIKNNDQAKTKGFVFCKNKKKIYFKKILKNNLFWTDTFEKNGFPKKV